MTNISVSLQKSEGTVLAGSETSLLVGSSETLQTTLVELYRWRRQPKILAQLCKETSGVAAVEFALIMPVFLVLMIGIVDLGIAYHAKLKISAAISAASYYAFQKGQAIDVGAVATYTSGISDVVTNMLSNIHDEVTVEVKFNNATTGAGAANFYCVSGYPPVYSNASATSVSCGANVMSGKFVSIAISGRIVPMFLSSNLFGSYFDVADKALVRVR